VKFPTNDDEIKEWVSARLAALDDTPRNPRWRHKALGMPRGVAIGMAPREQRLDLWIPVSEVRVLNDCAKGRELGTRAYMRRAIATVAVVCDDIDPGMIPSLYGGGLIGPP
jgi:hypothetical protein